MNDPGQPIDFPIDSLYTGVNARSRALQRGPTPYHLGTQTVRSAPLHPTTFDYLKPSDEQLRVMTMARKATKDYAAFLGALLPDGTDKTYVLRKLREIGMWTNVAIMRHSDGSPRE